MKYLVILVFSMVLFNSCHHTEPVSAIALANRSNLSVSVKIIGSNNVREAFINEKDIESIKTGDTLYIKKGTCDPTNNTKEVYCYIGKK